MWTRLSWRLAGVGSCALIASVQESSCRARSATVQREVSPAQPEDSEPGGNSVNGEPNTPSSKPNTSSSAGKEKHPGESRLCGVTWTGEDASGMSTGEDASVMSWTRKFVSGWTLKSVSVWTRKSVSVSVMSWTRKFVSGWTRKSVSVWTRKSVSVSNVGWKKGDSGGGCGGGSGETTLCGGGCGGGGGEVTKDAGVNSEEAVTNFCPGQMVPSLQVGVSGRRVRAMKVAARAVGEVVGIGHSAGVVGQQSQSISSSICSNVRPLFAAYIV